MESTRVASPVQHLAIVLTFSLGVAAPLAAQTPAGETDSRTEEIAAERDEKARQISPPRRSLVERALAWYDTHGLQPRWRALHFAGGNFPGGAGFAYGIGLSEAAIGSPTVDPDQPNRIDGSMLAARSARGYQRLFARMDVRNVGGRRADLFLGWQEYELTQEDFYGFGAGSAKSARTNYRLDGTEFATGFTWRPSTSLSIGGELSHLTPLIGEGTDTRYASTQSTYAEADVPGLSDLPSFVRASGSVRYDGRDSESHPRRGGQYTIAFARVAGVHDAAYDFNRLDVTAQQIIPLPNRYRRIELRAGAAFTDTIDGSDVPFIYQPAIGGLRTLRGFSESRFRDRSAMWASAEYQWEAWWALDAALFVDAGQVAAHRADFTWSAVEVTYGIGFRLHGNEHFIAKLDLAYGREGVHPLLGFKYGF